MCSLESITQQCRMSMYWMKHVPNLIHTDVWLGWQKSWAWDISRKRTQLHPTLSMEHGSMTTETERGVLETLGDFAENKNLPTEVTRQKRKHLPVPIPNSFFSCSVTILIHFSVTVFASTHFVFLFFVLYFFLLREVSVSARLQN